MVPILQEGPAASRKEDEASAALQGTEGLRLTLEIHDPECIAELQARPEGPQRQQYALTALRLGVIALRHASGAVDVATLRAEGERLISQVDKLVTGNANELVTRILGNLQEYFDPSSGKLIERLNRLVNKDGELSRLLAEHLDGETSRLARTLAQHVGDASPLMQMLSPQQKDGLLTRIQSSVAEALAKQAELILRQFSLDDRQSALSRCLEQLTDSNGKLRKDLAADVEAVRNEFSLNNEQGALAQLVRRVELASKSISDQFSFDNEQSAISRLSRQIRDLIEQSARFHEEVRRTLEVLRARKEESARSTRHGIEFEQVVFETIKPQVEAAGDLVERTGNSAGSVPHCKKGDILITLGAESAAPGARIVVECKEVERFRESQALEELKEARPNRGAQVGIFVFSKAVAPPGQQSLRRIGNDVLCVWDKEDPNTDIILTAAISIARALVIRQKLEDAQHSREIAALEDCVNRVEKSSKKLEEIETMAKTIAGHGQKILQNVIEIRQIVSEQVQRLREAIESLKADQEPAG
ncbi:MAG: hypothetical protein NZ561_00695 [Phycisphaerae bacterium]|nr:hypothetical protein [Phycisphaerae bacterium]MDW8261048.1 hypothetical protein [Phycisphaerales bacterium]